MNRGRKMVLRMNMGNLYETILSPPWGLCGFWETVTGGLRLRLTHYRPFGTEMR